MTEKALVFNHLQDCKNKLIAGNIGIIPTDTVYGLVVLAKDLKAVDKLSLLKGRSFRPGTIIAANINQLVELGFKRRYLTAVEDFWPGPISVIIPTGSSLEYLHHGLQSLAVRIPIKPELIKLLESTGPLMTSSANLTGKKSATNIEDAQKIFGDKIGFYVDGGHLQDKKESTIIQMNDDAVVVIREGAVKIDEETGRIINDI